MNEAITAYIQSMSCVFFVRQTAAIVLLFLLGAVVLMALDKKIIGSFGLFISFPTGLSVYSLSAFLLLVIGLPFNILTVSGLCILAALISIVVCVRSVDLTKISAKRMAIVILAVLGIAALSTSGILSVSLSNDSMYYYMMYPRALVKYGMFRQQFNVYLTDIGQMSAMINTIPHIYGFNESFGIQTFLNINTLIIIVYALYEQASGYLAHKEAMIAAGLSAGVLICSMPYIIMSKWVLSNSYFMCFMFICVYSAWKIKKMEGSLAMMGMMYAVMSFTRMEGCIAALIILLCFSVFDHDKKQIFLYLLTPMLIIYTLYYCRIFLLMHIDAPYTFLTPKKAVIQIAAVIAVSAYILFIRERLPEVIGSRINMLIPLGLVIVNMILLMYNKDIFIGNVKAFVANISNQSGWGLFPMMIIGMYVLCLIVSYKHRDLFKYTYWDLCFVSYMLTATAVSFARGDALRESIGDSGNRVMLQVILLAFFAAAEHILQLQEERKDGK